MMGSKKLAVIRKELRQKLAKLGDDPIRWLDLRIRELEQAGETKASGAEVLHSLRRLLATRRKPGKMARRTSRN